MVAICLIHLLYQLSHSRPYDSLGDSDRASCDAIRYSTKSLYGFPMGEILDCAACGAILAAMGRQAEIAGFAYSASRSEMASVSIRAGDRCASIKPWEFQPYFGYPGLHDAMRPYMFRTFPNRARGCNWRRPVL